MIEYSKIWFVLENEKVSGPLEPEEVEKQSETKQNILIWGRGMTDWQDVPRWRETLKQLLAQAPKWKLRVDKKESQLVDFDQMLEYLKTVTDFSHVEVWSESIGSKWKDVYSIRKIVEQLGITRRNHPRVPIMGTLKWESTRGQDINGRVVSISEGGLGLSDNPGLQIGERFKAHLTSPNLFIAINCTCEVAYQGQDGYTGIKFIGLPIEAKSAIIEYVKKFSQSTK